MVSAENTRGRVLLYTGLGIVVLGSLRATEVVCVVCVLGVYDGTVLVMDGRFITTEQNARDEYQDRVSVQLSLSSGIVPVALAVGGSVAAFGVCLYIAWRKMQGSAEDVDDIQLSRIFRATNYAYPSTGGVSTVRGSHAYMVNPYDALPSPYPTMPSQYPAIPSPYPAILSPYPAMQSPYSAMPSPYPAMPSPYPAMQSPYPATQATYNV